MTYAGPVAPALASEPTGQVATGAQAETIEPDAGPAPAEKGDDGTATVRSYPPLHQPAAVTVLDRGTPPPPPPTAILGRRVTIYNSGPPNIHGENGYVLEYDPPIERYRVLTTSPRISCS